MDLSMLTVSATKPAGRAARMLAEMGIGVRAIAEDEGNVDRYVMSKRLAAERFTGSSFLAGIMEKTLFTSAIYLREHFRIPIIVVEGQVNYEYTRFDPQAVVGALTAMMLEYGVNVLRTADLEETVRVLAMLARQEQVGIPEISLIPKRKATTAADMQRRVVEMLPGCGMVMARDLLQHFGSVRRIANATEDELRAMPGIGARKARQMEQVLNAEYEAVDTERNLEDAIEADHSLLFRREVVLLARQHHIYTDEKARHVVDMVFLDPKGDEIILVELKRRRLGRSDLEQLRRYIENAGQSKMLRPFIEKGTRVRGLLGTVEEGDWRPSDGDVSVTVVNRGRAIEVLARLRRQWLEELGGGSGGRRADE